jgi:hypothetical protein
LKSALPAILCAVCSAGGVALADDGGKQEIAREIGLVLAWRLGPEAVEERCRVVDPEGIAARQSANKTWLDENAALIEAVDTRVAQVVPLVYSPPPDVDAVAAVRAQVTAILLEPMFNGRTPEEMKKVCQAEAEPSNPRLANPGMREVQLSLAVLYDWNVKHQGKIR